MYGHHSQFHRNTLTWPGQLTHIWMCCKKNVSMTIGILIEMEHCPIHEQDSRSSQCWMKNFLQDTCGSEKRLEKTQATTRPDHLWPEIRSGLSKAAQRKEKQQWATDKPKFDDARKLRSMYFIKPGWGSVQGDHWNARKKWEIPMEAAMPCKLWTTKSHNKLLETDSETKGSNRIQKTKHACIVRALESMRKRVWNLLYQKIMKITSREKGSIRYVTTKWCTFVLVWESSSGQRMGEARKVAGVAIEQREEVKGEVVLEAQNREKNSSFCYAEGHLSSQKNTELEPKYQKYKGRVVLRGDSVKDDASSCAVFSEQGALASQMTATQSNGCHCKATWVCRTSSRRSIPLHSSKNGGRSKVAQNSRVWKSRNMDASSTTEVVKVMVKHWRSRGSSWAKSVWTPTCRPPVERQFENVWRELGLEKAPNWEWKFVHRKQELFLSVYLDDVSMAGRKHKLSPMWKTLMKLVDLGEPTSFLDHVY